MNTWSEFNKNTQHNPPRELYAKALKYIEPTNKIEALDIAAGACNETSDMLQRGFNVTAIDANPDITTIAAKIGSDALSTSVTTMEDYAYGDARFDFVVAMFALPFIPPAKFEDTFQNIVRSLKPEGVFAFHLFGERDGWSPNNTMTFFDKDRAQKLIKSCRELVFREVESDSKTADGSDRHWHVFQVIVKKNHGLEERSLDSEGRQR